MSVRRPPLIAAMLSLLALGPVLASCHSRGPDAPPPPSTQAIAAMKNTGGAPRDSLGRAIDRLFDEETVGHTDALLIMKRGAVIVERYGDNVRPDTRLPGWSAGQCVTTLMIGQLVSDGRLRLNESAPVPEWQRPGDPRGVITLKHLLQMRSGLRHVEAARMGVGKLTSESDRTRMLFLDGRDDMAAYAEAQPLEAPAGKLFEHSSASAVILADLAARVLSPDRNPERRRLAVNEYLRSRILVPIGMPSTIVSFDRAGTMTGSGMIAASARDWANLGEFLRHTGSVSGAQILPRRWVQAMLAPSPREPGFGEGVWLNQGERGDGAKLWPGTAPKTVFACLGEYGQYVIGSPDQLLTVVRIGRSDAAQERALHDHLGNLLALFPKN
ncbi:serine hydrolase domain-containing protein [Novosphingobium sp. Leaf2]|uniref:serine hydrolase domain-containing protein n=1 Tax=Novosphingobium sp. Leaf2 TaxID=1735670 RepID=UPI0006F7B415|nr:serine hydrolase [Novosphingobium sp. Leaf2]KQM22020.1 serine hydrolase [Novosphingobium sp. Leaf2]